MLTEHLLDAREMEPPEPFNKAVAILANMQQGEYLRMLHRRIPYPFFDACEPLSLEHEVKETSPNSFQIIIFFGCDREALEEKELV